MLLIWGAASQRFWIPLFFPTCLVFGIPENLCSQVKQQTDIPVHKAIILEVFLEFSIDVKRIFAAFRDHS